MKIQTATDLLGRRFCVASDAGKDGQSEFFAKPHSLSAQEKASRKQERKQEAVDSRNGQGKMF